MPVGTSQGLITRCPECHTAFRVNEAQLAARQGLVRCGRCSRVFDALRYLVPASPGTQKPPAGAEAETTRAPEAAPEAAFGKTPDVAPETTSEVTPEVASEATEAAPEIAAEAVVEAAPEVAPEVPPETPPHPSPSQSTPEPVWPGEPESAEQPVPDALSAAPPEIPLSAWQETVTQEEHAQTPHSEEPLHPAGDAEPFFEPAIESPGEPAAESSMPSAVPQAAWQADRQPPAPDAQNSETPFSEPALSESESLEYPGFESLAAEPAITAALEALENIQPPGDALEDAHREQSFEAFDALLTQSDSEQADQAAPAHATPEEEIAGEEPSPSADDIPSAESFRLEPAPPEAPIPLLEDAEALLPPPEPELLIGRQAKKKQPQMEFDFGPKRRARRMPLWLSIPCLLVLLAVLAGQAAYMFRTDLAVLFPQFRPQAERLCARLGCDLPAPRRAEYMSIEASDLAADPDHPGVMVLSASLRNRAPFPEAQPALELTLTDAQNQPVARRVLMPADYHVDGLQEGALPPVSEFPVKVYFNASSLNATGYRLYLFYP